MLRFLQALLFLALASLLAACAAPPPAAPPAGEIAMRFGRVTQVEPVLLQGQHQAGGAVVGAITGGILGRQIGGGSGRDLATGAGVVSGAAIGNQMGNRGNQVQGQHVTIQLDGTTSLITVTQPADVALRPGDRVRVEGSGPNARAVRIG